MKAYLSKLACEPLTEYLRNEDYQLQLLTGEGSPVYDAVKTHADIHMCRLGIWENHEIFMGNPAKLTTDYPGNIRYNAVCTGKYFIHNLKYTAPELLQAAKVWKGARDNSPGSYNVTETASASHTLHFVHVPQGYTRCCCLPVDDTSFVTSDEGIAKHLASAGADVLLIEKGSILLPGFDFGFIGGCAGHLLSSAGSASTCGETHRIILFNGDLSVHPDYHRIAAFLSERHVMPVFFEGHPLTDIGSILTA